MPNGVSVGNYLYYYSTPEQARQSAQIFLDRIFQYQVSAKFLDEFNTEGEAQWSQAVSFIGDEGDDMYWFVTSQDQTLVLLNVNGFNTEQVKRVFSSSRAKILKGRSTNSMTHKIYLPLLSNGGDNGVSSSHVDATQWQTAYAVNEIFTDPSGLKHYGARFSGTNGASQYFTGASGQPSGYSSWTWHPSSRARSTLLLEKSWLFNVICVNAFGTPSICYDRWTGSNHHARMTCPC